MDFLARELPLSVSRIAVQYLAESRRNKENNMTGNGLISRSAFLGLLATVLLVACTDSTEQATGSEDRVDLKSVRVNDTTLHYIDRGQGSPVVFVHGRFGDYRTWNGQIDAFSEKYRVISYSRRLQYPNEIPSNAASATEYWHVEDLRALLQALDIDRFHLVGHSGGGAISLLFALDYSESLISLTLGEPAVSELLSSTPEGASLLQDYGENVSGPSRAAFRAGNEEEGLKLFINGVFGAENAFDNLTPYFRDAMLQNAARSSTIRGAGRRPSFSCDDASSVRVPTLLIHGELSPQMFVSINDTLEQCLPNVERATLPAASHGLEMENAEDFNRIVLEFVGRHE